MEKKKRNILITIVLLIGIIAIIGVSYALWVLNLNQTGQNDIVSSCFNITFTDKNNINLQKAYPILDEDGKQLTPYEFTITNTCDSYASFNVNLEVLNTTTLTNNDAVKVMISSKTGATETEITTNLLSSYKTTTKTLDNAKTAFNLTTGYLNAKESKTYTLRLWLDENVGMNTEGVQNAKFSSKVVIVTSYIEKLPKPAAETILELVNDADVTSTDVYTIPDKANDNCTYTLAYDGTTDNNLRYVGANPCNYVTFNGEEAGWRIIGVLNTLEGKRIKLIRKESIGKYSWDNKSNSTNRYGNSSWTTSPLKEVLNNGVYYNRTSGTCPYGENGATTSCDFTNNGLTEISKKQIDMISWKSSGPSSYEEITSGLASNWYVYEGNGGVQGQVGLMYPSDYGYAVGENRPGVRRTCLSRTLQGGWSNSSYSYCSSDNWLYNSDQWLLSRYLDFSYYVFFMTSAGNISYDLAIDKLEVKPAIYLKQEVLITSGEGTESNPYILSEI